MSSSQKKWEKLKCYDQQQHLMNFRKKNSEVFFFMDIPSRTLRYPTKREKENHRLKSTFGGEYVIVAWKVSPPKKRKIKSTHQLKSLVHPSSIPSKKKTSPGVPMFFNPNVPTSFGVKKTSNGVRFDVFLSQSNVDWRPVFQSSVFCDRSNHNRNWWKISKLKSSFF